MILANGMTLEIKVPSVKIVMQTPAPSQVLVLPVPGLPGPPGPIAPVLTYSLSAVSSWTQAHTFAYPPDVYLISGGEMVRITVTYPDANHVHLSFPNPFTGTVVLR